MQNATLNRSPLMIQWRDYYSVGDQTLDTQHQTIISLINWLYEIILGGEEDRRAIPTIMRRLNEYTQYHFKDEERVMLEAGFPHYAAHQRSHEKLTGETRDLLFKSLQNGGPDAREVLRFLKQWWIGHITGEDKEYMFYLKRKNDCQSPGQLGVEGDLAVLVTALIENEQRIGHYYEIMVECLPEYRETWAVLQTQEASHAAAMQRISQIVEETPALVAVGKFSPKAARVMSHEIDAMIKKIEEGAVHPGYAVSFAKDVEQSLLESHLAEAVKTDLLEVKSILARLDQETISHRLMLHNIVI